MPTPETVGIGLMIGLPLLPLLLRRRLDALRVFCVFGGALALAEVVPDISLFVTDSPGCPPRHADELAEQ